MAGKSHQKPNQSSSSTTASTNGKITRKRDHTLITNDDSSPVTSPEAKKNKGADETCSNCTGMSKILENISAKLEKLDKIEGIVQSIDEIKEEIKTTKTLVETVQTNVDSLHEDLENVKSQVNNQKYDRETVETEVRKINLVVAGVPDDEKENETLLRSKVQNIFNLMIPKENVSIDTVTRLGKFNQSKTRFVRVRFVTMRERELVWRHVMKQKPNPPVYINEDLPYSVRNAHNVLRKKAKELTDRKIQNKINYSKFCILTPDKNYELNHDLSFKEIAAVNIIPPRIQRNFLDQMDLF